MHSQIRRLAGPGCWRPVLTAAAVVAMSLPAAAHSVEKHFPVEGRPLVILQNSNGHVEIKSWKKAEVMVIGDYGSNKNVDIETEQAGSRIEIGTHILNPASKPAERQTDYQITVPEESELQIRTESGGIVVESVHGDLTFETIAADVNLQDVGGYLVVNTTEGAIVCTRCDGSIKAESVSGNVQLFQPVMNSVTLHTTAGNILFDGDFLRRGVYILRSDTGNTEVRFGKASSFDLRANALHGTVVNKAALEPDKHGWKSHLPHFGTAFASGRSAFGSVGAGDARVDLSSFSGTITIAARD
ncbi:MAG TPA: DUF4097 family beta strand repeat-containing protein [Candidatus Acidoferrales bacterium]|nr:DUF4097 family beta strand repeat-containing protein [Candidatus Acidoferrales bacterium]